MLVLHAHNSQVEHRHSRKWHSTPKHSTVYSHDSVSTGPLLLSEAHESYTIIIAEFQSIAVVSACLCMHISQSNCYSVPMTSADDGRGAQRVSWAWVLVELYTLCWLMYMYTLPLRPLPLFLPIIPSRECLLLAAFPFTYYCQFSIEAVGLPTRRESCEDHVRKSINYTKIPNRTSS